MTTEYETNELTTPKTNCIHTIIVLLLLLPRIYTIQRLSPSDNHVSARMMAASSLIDTRQLLLRDSYVSPLLEVERRGLVLRLHPHHEFINS